MPARSSWGSLSLSVLLHGLLAGAAVAAYFWVRDPEPTEQRLAIEATVVTSLPANRPQSPPPEPEPPPPEAAAEPPSEAAVDSRAAEREAQAAARVAEERRVADERAVAERKEQETVALRKAEEAAREKAARDKATKDKAEKERAERERLEKEKARLERVRTERETELNAQIAAEERVAAARASGVMAQYVSQITARIERAWIRPSGAVAGLQCEVRVTQVPGGAVTGVQVGRCNGDESVRQSIEAAVYRASPLPLPQDPALFERNLVVTFKPEN